MSTHLIFPKIISTALAGLVGQRKKANHFYFFTEKEIEAKEAIETLMDYKISQLDFPEAVTINWELTPEEKESKGKQKNPNRNIKEVKRGASFHEKKTKNKKTNLGSSYKRKMAKKYKKPKTRGGGKRSRRK